MPRQKSPRPSPSLVVEACGALEATLAASVAAYDRNVVLRRFHRLASKTIESSTPEAGRAILAELERALRKERARIGHWTYDLNRHIELHAVYRAEKARFESLKARSQPLGQA